MLEVGQKVRVKWGKGNERVLWIPEMNALIGLEGRIVDRRDVWRKDVVWCSKYYLDTVVDFITFTEDMLEVIEDVQ